jgi:hypothetical protein
MRISLHSLVKIIYKKDYRTREEKYRTKYINYKVHFECSYPLHEFQHVISFPNA